MRKISASIASTPAYATVFSRRLTAETWAELVDLQIERARDPDPKVHVPALRWIEACVEKLAYQQAVDDVQRVADRHRLMASSLGGERKAPWSLLGRA